MPASATVLMGIHSGTYYGPGGFDGSSWNLFWDNNADTTAANAAAVKGIGEYWNTYLHNPKEVKFFLQKTAWQWLDPWFEALTMNGPSITVMPVFFRLSSTVHKIISHFSYLMPKGGSPSMACTSFTPA